MEYIISKWVDEKNKGEKLVNLRKKQKKKTYKRGNK